jgi:hypothetical protein
VRADGDRVRKVACDNPSVAADPQEAEAMPTADRQADAEPKVHPDSTPRPGRALVRLASDNRLFACAVGVATLLRVIVVIAYRPALFFTGDSVVYLDNAMHLQGRRDPSSTLSSSTSC